MLLLFIDSLFEPKPKWYKCPHNVTNTSCMWYVENSKNTFHNTLTYAILVIATNFIEKAVSKLYLAHTLLKGTLLITAS